MRQIGVDRLKKTISAPVAAFAWWWMNAVLSRNRDEVEITCRLSWWNLVVFHRFYSSQILFQLFGGWLNAGRPLFLCVRTLGFSSKDFLLFVCVSWQQETRKTKSVIGEQCLVVSLRQNHWPCQSCTAAIQSVNTLCHCPGVAHSAGILRGYYGVASLHGGG